MKWTFLRQLLLDVKVFRSFRQNESFVNRKINIGLTLGTIMGYCDLHMDLPLNIIVSKPHLKH